MPSPAIISTGLKLGNINTADVNKPKMIKIADPVLPNNSASTLSILSLRLAISWMKRLLSGRLLETTKK